jgi:transcriptional regulator with XRE-family HTH domain
LELSLSLNLTEYVVMEFGNEIRRRRLALGMTLEQLAEASKLTPNYIGTIENGKRDPSLSTVMALAKGLRINPGELFGGLQDLSAAATEAGLLFEGATSDVQEAVLQLLRSVSRRKKVLKAGTRIPETTPLQDVG